MVVTALQQVDGRLSEVSHIALSRVGRVPFLPAHPRQNRRAHAVARAQPSAESTLQDTISRTLAVSTAASTLLASGSALAAAEITELAAASDNRFGSLLLLAAPVVAWVLYNMWEPALNQLDTMSDKQVRGLATGLGLTAASLLAASGASASSEVLQLAESDGRFGIITLLFLPVVGWVLFNIFGPALNQLDSMGKKSAVGALGLGSLLLAGNADAATEVMQLADSDGRFGIIALLFLPVIGWVGFNILGPALSQFDKMKKGIATGFGLTTAGLIGASQAEAVSEVMQLADNDGRFGIILTLFLPVVGWVAFNIFGPAINQLDTMSKK